MNRFRFLPLAVLVATVAAPCSAAAASEAVVLGRIDLLALDPGSNELAQWRPEDQVPEAFFHDDLLPLIDSGLNYTSQFSLSRDLHQPILVLENARADSEGYPVTLCLGDGKGTWRNFVVGFDASGRLDLSLSRAVTHLESTLAGIRGRPRGKPTTDPLVRVISGAAFHAYLWDGDEIVSALEVIAPSSTPAEKAIPNPDEASTSPAFCCEPNLESDNLHGSTPVRTEARSTRVRPITSRLPVPRAVLPRAIRGSS
ncbi:MAG: hypothetical protein MI919_03025 [Holophagales bacterium]|nr:hypothetical protein [Holophagales bacterium]